MGTQSKGNLEPYERRRLAVEADVHPKTLDKYLQRRPTRSIQRNRIERVLREQGLEHLLRKPTRTS